MTGLLARPDQVAAVRTYVPLLRRMRSAGWEPLCTGPWERSWRRGKPGRRDLVLLKDMDSVIIRPYSAPEWDVPIISAGQLTTILELAGVIPPVPQPTADMVARRTIRALRARGWRPPRDEDDDYARDELYPLPPNAHGYPVGGRAPHVSGQHDWQDCPDLSGTEATS